MTNVYIETYGCSQNFADSEQMAGLLKEAQFKIILDFENADIVIINTCTVKSPTDTAFFKRLQEIKEKYPYKIVIVAGCIAQTEPKKLAKYPLVGTKQIQNIVEVVEEALNDSIIKMLDQNEMPPLNTPRVRKNEVVAIIPISRGCLGACSFCKTKFARGKLCSYTIDEIKKEAQLMLKEDVKEIWLTSQDTGCYGFDIETTLPELLTELVKIPGNFKIRIGMMNPNHLIKIKDQLFPLLNNEKIFQFLHLPLQSGNNTVLKLMNRKYTREGYLQLIKEIRFFFPEMTIATDLIVGFPTETDEYFWDTQTAVREFTPDVVNISRYWVRAGTKAAEMKQLLGETVKHRSRIIRDICYNITKMQNEKWIGLEGNIIIDEFGKESGQFLGRNKSYKQVLIKGNFKLGDVVKVKIEKVTPYYLIGKVY
jgi:threonylcarbamoyladenosine tRNA methylthiotransferase CDKAL1